MEFTVDSRPCLEALWLPWCVDGRNRREIIEIQHQPERRAEALQLRVGDICNDEVRGALSTQVHKDGGSSLDVIVRRAREYAGAADGGEPVVIDVDGGPEDPAVFVMREGLMLREGCHRACALYESGADRFKLSMRVDELTWRCYDWCGLRPTR